MGRKISRWGVTLLGLLLLGWGAAAMWTGWGMVQIERGWSLFIAGAAALAGGAVTLALGLVLARLDQLIAGAPAQSPLAKAAPAPAPGPENLSAWVPPPAKAAERKPAPAPEAAPNRAPEPLEVDRYSSGDTTYVMFSDGSVEVRDAAGARRYRSLADLRAETPLPS